MDVTTVIVCASIVGIIRYWIVPLWEYYQQQKFQREQEAQWELEAQAEDREIMRKRKQQQENASFKKVISHEYFLLFKPITHDLLFCWI